MAIARTQYITVAELNEILGVTTYINSDLIKIYEASELLEYHMYDRFNKYDTSNAPDKLKIATAYQVQYNESGIDDEYASTNENFSIGKYSSGKSSSNIGSVEYKKISPKSRRLLIDGGLIRRII